MAGNPTPNHIELSSLDYIDSEEQLRRNLYGGEPLCGETLFQEGDQTTGKHAYNVKIDSDGPKFVETLVRAEKVNSDPKLEFHKTNPPRLSSYVKARVVHF